MATQESIDLAQEMYVAYYGRPADPAGLDFWAEQFDLSDDLDLALLAFGNSDEFQNGFGDLTDEELIVNLFDQLYNRVPDAAGLAFYLDRLESGEASLASIAKQIADGAQGDDLTTLNNKTDVANTFTEEVRDEDAPYNSSHIPAAQELIGSVDETDASVTTAEAAIPGFVETINGAITLTEDNPTGDYSSSAVGVTVTLDGDDSETEFDVTGSPLADRVIPEEYFKADIAGGLGNDTVDFSEADGDYYQPGNRFVFC